MTLQGILAILGVWLPVWFAWRAHRRAVRESRRGRWVFASPPSMSGAPFCLDVGSELLCAREGANLGLKGGPLIERELWLSHHVGAAPS